MADLNKVFLSVLGGRKEYQDPAKKQMEDRRHR
jgi:hypothetical protein